MPKTITSILDPEQRPRKRRKRRKRKVDYTELLQAPIIPDSQCPHTKRAQDKTQCSQCMSVQPSVVHKAKTVDWWAEDELDLDLDLVVNIDIDSIVPDEEV